MAHLPMKCEFCEKTRNHYGSCDCAEAELANIKKERETMTKRFEELVELEKAALRRRLVELGVLHS